MKDALMEHGIPESEIVLDYAGFRTLDSVVRCKEVFGQENMTVVSQGFHNARAVCLASWYGVNAVGFDAKDIKHSRTYLFFGVGREALARTKMFVDMIVGKKPKFLGERIEIQ
jgi:SanA protein